MSDDIHDPDFVAGVFDRCAGNYRRWAVISSFGFVTRWRKACIAALRRDDLAGGTAVDLMAGTGEIWPHFLARYPDIGTITAIDISRMMHEHAVERLHSERSDRITHIAADFLETDLEDNIADCVISSFGLKTLSKAQQEVFARQLARILKPGGVYSMIEASDPKGWALRPLYRFYLDRVLPLVERLFLNGAQDFSMIGTYTRRFGDCSHMAACLRRQGLSVTQHRHFFGCATGLNGRKPPENES